MSYLKKAAIKGSIWVFTGFGLGQILRLASNLILTRLLFPEMFGLMSLVSTFTIGLRLFSDIGISPSIIQNRRGNEPEFLNTAWTIQIMRGFALWCCCFIIAWPAAKFYNEKQLIWLIPILGITTFIEGFNSTALVTLNRDLSLGKLTILNLSTQIIMILTMIVWAWQSPTIWALVAGNIVSVMITMILSHRMIPNYHNRLHWDKSAVRELFSFGRWVFISTAMTFLAAQSDKLILGKFFTFSMLGVYSIAFQVSDIPNKIIQQISNKIIFPVISNFNMLPRDMLRDKISQKRLLLLLGIVVLIALFVSFGDLLILFLYDKRYEDASWMLVILSLGLWPRLSILTAAPALLALGKPFYFAFGNSIKVLYIIVCLPLAFFYMGYIGAIVVIALDDVPLYLIANYALWREGLLSGRQDFYMTMLLFGLIIFFCLIRYLFHFGLPLAGIL